MTEYKIALLLQGNKMDQGSSVWKDVTWKTITEEKKKKHEMLPKTTALVGILEATRKVHMLILFLNSPLEIGQIKSLRFEHSHSLKKMVRIFTI